MKPLYRIVCLRCNCAATYEEGPGLGEPSYVIDGMQTFFRICYVCQHPEIRGQCPALLASPEEKKRWS